MIFFNKALTEGTIYHSLNNNIIEFYSTNPLTPIKSELLIGGIDYITIYPNANGLFWLNVKDYVNAQIQSNKFQDDLDIQPFSNSNYLFDWTSKIFLQLPITIKTIFEDLSFETATLNPKFLSSYTNEKTSLSESEDIILLNKNNKYKYWVGYPFEIDFYKRADVFTLIKNDLTNDITTPSKIVRLFFSDGILNTELQAYFPKFRINEKEVFIDVIEPQCYNNKIYIKYLNSLGGWNYYLFNNYNEQLTTKDLGELFNDYNNVEDTVSKTLQVGKTSISTLEVTTDAIEYEEALLLRDLLDSPKVYLFTGQPNTASNYNDWVEVAINNNSYSLYNSKLNKTIYNFKIELPTNTTRTLWDI